MPTTPSPKRARRTWVLPLAAVAVLAAIGGGAYLWAGGDAVQEQLGATDRIVRGPMRVTINASGEVEADEKEVIRNDLPWSARISYVVANGSPVKQDQRVLEFECKELTEALEREEMATDTAHEAFLRAERNLDLKKRELANKLAAASQAVLDAKADLVRYEQGEYPIKLAEHRQEIALAERDRRLAEEKLEFKKQINADPKLGQPYSENDLRAEQLSVDRLKLAEEKAKSKLQMLEKFDHPREMQRLQAGLSSSELGEDRAELEYEAELSIAETELKYKEKAWKDHKAKLEEYQGYEKNKRVVKASKSGFVVYDSWPWWNRVEVAVGEEVNPRHQLMIIPNTASLQIRTKVYEAMIEQINARLEQKEDVVAYVRFDAIRDKVFTGKVHWVAPQPEQQDRRRNPDVKVFKVIIKLDGDVAKMDLSTNMSAKIELVINELNNVLQAPVAAIFPEGKHYYVYKVVGGRSVKTEVTVGGSNDKRIQILSGLDEGDVVRLTRPDLEKNLPTREEDAEEPAEPQTAPDGEGEAA